MVELVNPDTPLTPSAVSGFAKEVCRYFLDFLETDFKKQRAPRRRIQLKNDAGFRTGLPLRKYPRLYEAVWGRLKSPVEKLTPLKIKRRQYTAPLSPVILNLIGQHADAITPADIQDVRSRTCAAAERELNPTGDIEAYVDKVRDAFVAEASACIIAPLLALLEGPFSRSAHSAVESVYEIETDLVELLTAPVVEQLPDALTSCITTKKVEPLIGVLTDFFSDAVIKERRREFFDDFSTNDAYEELAELWHYTKLGGEDLKVYLYICDIRFGSGVFPLFYVPLTVSDDASEGFTVRLEPHLYAHKRAVTFIAQELESTAAALALSPLSDRITYFEPADTLLGEISRSASKVVTSFNLPGDIDFAAATIQTSSSSKLKVSTAMYLAACDPTDESLLNDYEAMLVAAKENENLVFQWFEGIIAGVLTEDPVNIGDHVDQEWDRTSPSGRLVAESPIPLNEEQRKILLALKNPKCRFIQVQGPPGTGKSHTISALAFDCILTGKNVLVLSDKREALDVVYDKLTKALSEARPGEGDDFPNPILRLGKTGNSYPKLISAGSVNRIKTNFNATEAHIADLYEDIGETRGKLEAGIDKTIQAYSEITLREIASAHRLEAEVDEALPKASEILRAVAHPEAAGTGAHQAGNAYSQTSAPPADQTLKLTLRRPTGIVDVTVPVDDLERGPRPRGDGGDWMCGALGLTLAGDSSEGHGVVIAKVERGSRAYVAGVRPGDGIESINDTSVSENADVVLQVEQGGSGGASSDAEVERFFSRRAGTGSLDDLASVMHQHQVAQELVERFREHESILGEFAALKIDDLERLDELIAEYDNLRWPVFGFFFCRTAVRALDSRVGRELNCRRSLDLHKRLHYLRTVHDCLSELERALRKHRMDHGHAPHIYQLLNGHDDQCPEEVAAVRVRLEEFREQLGQHPAFLKSLGSGEHGTFSDAGAVLRFVKTGARFIAAWRRLAGKFDAIPSFDFVGLKSRLEQLQAIRMSHGIDERFLDFVKHKKNTAKTLGKVIKAKQQFPVDAFGSLKEAFPCIIAGIRDFAEYVPLQRRVFDIVIIDEASQVSVAQAFPALLRANTTVVFGDDRQFSNVKSSNASNAINNGYRSTLNAYFREHISQAAMQLQRLKSFDVKNSVLEFVGLCANHTEMLRKHFRGYQELISFCSRTFYDGQLQAIKVRQAPIEEVLKFSFVTPTASPTKNTNSSEADFIVEQLHRMLEEGDHRSVGIITPFREQQQLITRTCATDGAIDRFERELHLKVMTFDTCQGEERKVVFYSMVASEARDRLNYVFPTSLDSAGQLAEEKLRMQRLNVGLSRAEECIHFVLSKPVDQFRGSIGRVLSHFQTVLATADSLDAVQVDPKSPMEPLVKDWLAKTRFLQEYADRVTIKGQFPIGRYLKQLDPHYDHPKYRCDFLILYRGNAATTKIILEYDGFEHHFSDRDKVDAGNFERYRNADDVERELVLESYGYKFLRLNRFNVGHDPVEKLSRRLYDLVGPSTGDRTADDAGSIGDIKNAVDGLEKKESMFCPKCSEVKPAEEFFDHTLKKGLGGFGKICLQCKL